MSRKDNKMAGTEKYLLAPGEDWDDHAATERSDHDPAQPSAAQNGGSLAVELTTQIDPVKDWHDNEYAFGD
jgi:hypothetical protein